MTRCTCGRTATGSLLSTYHDGTLMDLEPCCEECGSRFNEEDNDYYDNYDSGVGCRQYEYSHGPEALSSALDYQRRTQAKLDYYRLVSCDEILRELRQVSAPQAEITKRERVLAARAGHQLRD